MAINGQTNGQAKPAVHTAVVAQPTAADFAALQAQIAALRAQNAALTAETAARKAGKLGFKVSEKKAVTITNLRRMGVTLYADEVVRILKQADDLKAFIKANFNELNYKTVESANAVAEYVGHVVKELDR